VILFRFSKQDLIVENLFCLPLVNVESGVPSCLVLERAMHNVVGKEGGHMVFHIGVCDIFGIHHDIYRDSS